MLDGLLPTRLDNQYRGSRVALWLFGLVVALKSAQSLSIILNGYTTARDAAAGLSAIGHGERGSPMLLASVILPDVGLP